MAVREAESVAERHRAELAALRAVVSEMARILVLASVLACAAAAAAAVRVDVLQPAPTNARVTKEHAYDAQVTLSIEHDDGTTTPSGWSTRREGGGNGQPFSFTPGRNLIEGWTQGVLKMREGERAHIHVPAALGYGGKPMGSPGSSWFIPANSNLLFDIEIVGKAGKSAESEL